MINHVTSVNGCCSCGYNKSSKYFLCHQKISFSSLRMFPVESFIEVVVFKLFPCKRQMDRQNTLVCRQLVGIQPMSKFLPRVFLDNFTTRPAAFHALDYWYCILDDDFFCNKALKVSFFAWIASSTSWFHQDVLFSLPTAILSHFNPPLSSANEIITVWKNGHFISMPSKICCSCQNFDAIWMQTVSSHLCFIRFSHFIL